MKECGVTAGAPPHVLPLGLPVCLSVSSTSVLPLRLVFT